jgi:hypothetical protein
MLFMVLLILPLFQIDTNTQIWLENPSNQAFEGFFVSVWFVFRAIIN